MQGGIGIPFYFRSGEEGDKLFLIIELLGPSINTLLEYCNGKFTLLNVLAIAEQIVIVYIRSPD